MSLFRIALCILAAAIAASAARAASSKTSAKNDLAVWPNRVSQANSDPWLVRNHDRIRQMRPRLLVMNFANGVPSEKARQKVDDLIAAMRESSRYHGYQDPNAPAFLDYQIEKFIDMTDAAPPAERLDNNSTKFPRVPDWKEGRINFRYKRLFEPEFTRHYDIRDPKDRSRTLSLAELVDRGIINEVWFLAYHGKYGSPFESIEVKQDYDERFQKIPGKSRQAGNGGDPEQPFIGRSLRILFINVERGIGCAMESLGHSYEGMARSGAIPYLKRYFEEYGGFDLDEKYGTPFDSLYACPDDVSYPDPTTLVYPWKGETRTVKAYVPVGGNVHFVPNGRRDYDMDNTAPVLSTIEHYRRFDGPDGKDKAEIWTPQAFEKYRSLAPDCMGRWLVYWRQNMPGLNNLSLDDSGRPMKNWWPFLFY
ncbi:MAG: hypothetical protein KY468_01395 [Armatimonadetes bacterium]|nr:hypothetical protein [Armatimonadota bacterium]